MRSFKKIIISSIALGMLLGFSAMAAEQYDSSTLLVKMRGDSSGYGLEKAPQLITSKQHLFSVKDRPSLFSAQSSDGDWFVAQLNPNYTTEQAMNIFRNDPNVLEVSYNYQVELQNTPNPESGSYADIVQNPLASMQWALTKSGVQETWQTLEHFGINGGGNSGVVVAVIDTGVEYTHPDLAENMWHNTGEIAGDGIDNEGNGYIDDAIGYNFGDGGLNPANPMDTNGHGTHCAGIIAAQNNTIGTVGVAYNVKIMPVKVIGATANLADMIQGIEYAVKNGAQIISMSLGITGESSALKEIVTKYENDVIIVAAAGNSADGIEGTSNLAWPNEAADGALGVVATYPAAYPNVVGVMSYQQTADEGGNYKASSSRWDPNYKNWIEYEIIAPGVNIASTYVGGKYANMSGTSMATPYVSGCYALLLSKYMNKQGYTIAEVKSLLLENPAKLQGNTLKNVVYTYDSVDIQTAIEKNPVVNITLKNSYVKYDGTVKQAPPAKTDQECNINYTYSKEGEAASPVQVGKYDVTAKVDELFLSGETTGKMIIYEKQGDFNGDNTIDFDDLNEFSAHYNSTAEDEAYSEFVDYNADGAIDAKDLLSFVRRMTKK